jgi:Tfp pilus assembly protein PilN
MATVGLQAADGLPDLGTHWLGALSLLAELPGQKADEASPDDAANQRPWHMDCRLSADLPSNQLVGRRFLAGAIAGSLAALAVTVTVWQLYVSSSLQADTSFWEEQMAKNEKLFADLTRDNRTLATRSARLDYAYDLMGTPYVPSEFILNLGRTLPPHMRINRVEANDTRVALSGGLREPSEEASRTLGRYLEELRRAPAIGPLFSNIGLTALQRDDDSDTLAFEITFKLKTAQP